VGVRIHGRADFALAEVDVGQMKQQRHSAPDAASGYWLKIWSAAKTRA
jgi:hypothetical protein